MNDLLDATNELQVDIKKVINELRFYKNLTNDLMTNVIPYLQKKAYRRKK